MKKVTLLCGMLLTWTATMASAAPGVNLRWTDCFGDGGVQNRNFACDTNAGNHVLRGSFVLGAGLPQVSGVEVVVYLATASPVLPEWWDLRNVGSCRGFLSLSISAFDGTSCFDWALGMASMNIAAYHAGLLGPNSARVIIVNAVLLADVQDLIGGTEYTSFQLNISNALTVGTPCTGCQVPACIVFVRNDVATVDPPFQRLEGATDAAGTSFWVTWPGGGGVITPGGEGCPAATPTRRNSWSAVKALYR